MIWWAKLELQCLLLMLIYSLWIALGWLISGPTLWLLKLVIFGSSCWETLKVLQSYHCMIAPAWVHPRLLQSHPNCSIHRVAVITNPLKQVMRILRFTNSLQRSSSDDNLSDLLSSDSEDEKEERKKAKTKRRRSVTPDINDPGNRVREQTD